jgi:hypothetical protein
MRVENKTAYPTQLLVAIIKNVLADVAKHEGRKFNRKLHTTIKYGKSGRLSGWARYDGTQMLLRLPKADVPVGHFAALVEHESLHLLGKKHGPGFGCTITAAQNAAQTNRLAGKFVSSIPFKEPPSPTVSLLAPEAALAYKDFLAHAAF